MGKPQGHARPSRRGRYESLDGLRGAASLVVLFHHALLTVPPLAGAYFQGGERPAPWTGDWALAYTPLHLAWAGTEAVYIFFVLSGVVLILPVLGGRFAWKAYYPRRVVRIYGPVWVAIGFAIVMITLVPRASNDKFGSWLNSLPQAWQPGFLLRDASLVFGTSGVLSPLWSLQWEVIFSLTLPAFVAFVIYARRLWAFKLIGVLIVSAMGFHVGNGYLIFMPMFAVGTLFAAEWETIREHTRNLSRWTWLCAFSVSILLLTSRWLSDGLTLSPITVPQSQFLAFIGAAMLVPIAGFWTDAVRVLTWPPFKWLGKISFSLYLVHEPIVIAARIVTIDLSPWAGIAISLPISLLAATVFTRLVERPFHSLSKIISARFASAAPPRSSPGMSSTGN
ncbi:acyltransferase [Plantibacter sp. T3]|uniref:acyltransferase family protein n=1 Tax=Plantibacter sp. T3 TaxID=2653161 RepID=UPI0012F25A45|nr:Acyltransferase [Plantibacter sp. T3]